MRKTPRQARSRETVERILEAGRVVLERDGYDAFSTNRVAAEAAVSPGSLYQYFPDKTTILDLVLDRWSVEVSDRVAAALADRIASPGPSLVHDTADALLAAVEADVGLLRVVWEELPGTRYRERRIALERRVRDLVTAYVAAAPTAASVPNPATTAWVLVIAVEHVAVRWVLDRPNIPRDVLLLEIVALARTLLPR